MTVTEPCVSPSTGTLGPDLRVNYAYGMVLGLDEFLQEQLHRLTRDYLHERGRHGYGTVSGLAVSVAPAGATDYTVTVSQGIAVDQWGREIVIRCDQCARIGAWLGVQEQAEPGVLAEHLSAGGEATVYVVASYADCLDALVPLPGQPCSSSDKTMAPSRIRDAWDVDLRWEPPKMPRWDTDRRLARLLGSVQFVAGLPEADSDEADILAAVLALADQADDGPAVLDPPANTWQLPLETAAAALDRLFTAWVTRVRPGPDEGLLPSLVDPEADSDPAVLLATITFTPASPFDPAAPEITGCEDPDDGGRPFLLHTQLIQELRWLGERGEAAPPATEPAPPETLVTLYATGGNPDLPTTVDAWFHLEKPVHLPETITVTDEDGGDSQFVTSAVDDQGNPTDFAFVWTLTAPEPGISARVGLQLEALFPATSVFVADLGTSLLDFEDASDVSFVDQDAQGDVSAYGVVHGAAQVAGPAEPSKEFVTITPVLNDGERLFLELWFHLEPVSYKDDVAMLEFEDKIFDETTGNQLSIARVVQSSLSPNLWYLELKHPAPGENVPILLRHLFPTYECAVQQPDGNQVRLNEWIDTADITFIGFDPSRLEIIAFSRSEPFRGLDPLRVIEGGRDFGRRPLVAPREEPVVDRLDRLVATVAGAEKAVARKAVTRKAAPAKKASARKAPATKAPARKRGGER